MKKRFLAVFNNSLSKLILVNRVKCKLNKNLCNIINVFTVTFDQFNYFIEFTGSGYFRLHCIGGQIYIN